MQERSLLGQPIACARLMVSARQHGWPIKTLDQYWLWLRESVVLQEGWLILTQQSRVCWPMWIIGQSLGWLKNFFGQTKFRQPAAANNLKLASFASQLVHLTNCLVGRVEQSAKQLSCSTAWPIALYASKLADRKILSAYILGCAKLENCWLLGIFSKN